MSGNFEKKATSAAMPDCRYLDKTKFRPCCTALKRLYCADPGSDECSFYKPLTSPSNEAEAEENA